MINVSAVQTSTVMRSVKKQLQLLLTSRDEADFSTFLKSSVPSITFLNDNVWHDLPDVRPGIEECDSLRVYLYDRPLESLPKFRRKNGDLEGPIAGCVIQVLRPRENDGVLRSGRLAVGFDRTDDRMRRFVNSVWKCVKQVGMFGVVCPDGRVDKHYLVGRHAANESAASRLRLRDGSVEVYFKPLVPC